MVAQPGVRFGLANGVLVAVLFVAAVARLQPEETAWVAVLVAGVVSIGLPVAMTTSMGVVAWALVTGFVENRYGELTLAPPDLFRLAVFAISTLGLAVFLHCIYTVVKEQKSV
jgi:hypothetical protein